MLARPADVALDDLRTVQLSFDEQLKIKTRVLSDKTLLVVLCRPRR